jgi:hypothetical protein
MYVLCLSVADKVSAKYMLITQYYQRYLALALRPTHT